MNVMVLGSCRVYRPLKSVEREGGITVRNEGVYGYAHCTKDAIQQLRYITAGYDLDPELARYIVDPRFYVPGERPGTLDGIDAVVVEISSRKAIVSYGDYLHITRFKATVERSHPGLAGWIVDLLARRVSEDRTAYLYPGIDDTGRRLVDSTSLVVQDEATVRADMATIRDMVDRPLLFVTHFEMFDRSGAAIEARRELREWVCAAADDLGVPSLDPSAKIREYGRSRAVRDHGHYHPQFIAELGKQIRGEYLSAWAPQVAR